MNKQALEAYLEFFTEVAGNDGEPWRRVSESDYSPFDSIVDKDDEPILEIAFSMRTGEPFLCWRGCGLAQLILELPATIPEITKRAIKAEDLKALCQELVGAMNDLVFELEDMLMYSSGDVYHDDNPAVKQAKSVVAKAKEVLGDGRL